MHLTKKRISRARKAEGFVPCPASRFCDASVEAIKRYDASIKWIDTHKHAVIGNGAFLLSSSQSGSEGYYTKGSTRQALIRLRKVIGPS